MSKTPKVDIGCARCPRKYASRAGFGVRVVNEMRCLVCPVCKAEIDAAKARAA